MTSYTGDGTSGILASAAKLAAGVFPYQRVTTAFDVTEQGQRDCYGVRFDGIDDVAVTSAINWGSNKVTVFAAVTSRSTTGSDGILEFGNTISLDGSFALTRNTGSSDRQFGSRGTTNAASGAVAGGTLPATNIWVGEADISAPLVSLSNILSTAQSTSSQGTGNFGNHVLRIGNRTAAASPFNGDVFAIIAVAGAYTTATKNRVRTLLSRITPTVNL
jgi:hypothetical protein